MVIEWKRITAEDAAANHIQVLVSGKPVRFSVVNVGYQDGKPSYIQRQDVAGVPLRDRSKTKKKVASGGSEDG